MSWVDSAAALTLALLVRVNSNLNSLTLSRLVSGTFDIWGTPIGGGSGHLKRKHTL